MKQNRPTIIKRQTGGLLLPGTGRGGLHRSKKKPPTKQVRQQWKKQQNGGMFE